jgi:transposase
MITNPKIERKKADIARTEIKLTDVKVRLRQQREELTKLEDDEIVAMFRSEVITEDDFAALLRSRRASATEYTDEPEENGDSPINRKEALPDAISEV